jgi:protocatechuate 3,4-dioxygenase beta subunit
LKTGVNMSLSFLDRRRFLQSSSAMVSTAFVAAESVLILPASAQALAPTATMRGGANNYLPGAPVVKRIGNGGFWMSGTVRQAGDGAPLSGIRIQIWAHTTEGSESDRHSHGATLTDANGVFRLEMPQIVPAFGQAHGHLAYEGSGFKTVFLRPIMASAKDTSLNAHFILQPT